MRARAVLAPAAALLLSGCLASKGDIRLLQDDMASLGAQQAQQAQAQAKARARSDSILRLRLDSAIVSLTVINDSVRAIGQRTMTFQANTSQALYDVGQQLITLQNRAGISQRQIQDLAAQLEAQHERMSPDSTPGGGAAKPQAQGPGPARLFAMGRDQYDNGAYGTARMAFTQMLEQYPDSIRAPQAMNYIAQTYEGESNAAAADSVYQALVAKFPQSPQAPSALYKHGLWLITQHQTADARKVLQRVVSVYPNSDAAPLATDRLRTLPNP